MQFISHPSPERTSKAALRQGDGYRDETVFVILFDGQAAVGKYREHRFLIYGNQIHHFWSENNHSRPGRPAARYCGIGYIQVALQLTEIPSGQLYLGHRQDRFFIGFS